MVEEERLETSNHHRIVVGTEVGVVVGARWWRRTVWRLADGCNILGGGMTGGMSVLFYYYNRLSVVAVL